MGTTMTAARKLNTRINVDLQADTFSDEDVPYIDATLGRVEDGRAFSPLTLRIVLYGPETRGGCPREAEIQIPGEYLDELLSVLQSVRRQRDSLRRCAPGVRARRQQIALAREA